MSEFSEAKVRKCPYCRTPYATCEGMQCDCQEKHESFYCRRCGSWYEGDECDWCGLERDLELKAIHDQHHGPTNADPDCPYCELDCEMEER